MLQLKNINVQFGAHHVLKNLSCSVEQGDFIIVVGNNGAGKSSFFDTIAGTLLPKSGHVIIDGQDVTTLNELQRSGMVTRIFQDTSLNSVGCLTVAQNLAIAQYSRRPVQLIDGMNQMPRQRAIELVNDLGMGESILDRPMNALSGGQRQLIAFVMSTQLIPKILLLDEPTAALDPQASTKLLAYAANFIKQHNVTTILITHDPQIALSLGNKIWILQDGVIAQEFLGSEKNNLHPDKLIGQIDYDALKKI